MQNIKTINFGISTTKDYEDIQVSNGKKLVYCSDLNMDQISHVFSLKVKSMSIKLYISICALNFKKLNKTIHITHIDIGVALRGSNLHPLRCHIFLY